MAIELKNKAARDKSEIFFWKSKEQEEVDFVIKEGLTVSQLIQACLDLSHPATKNREIRALIKAAEALHCDNLLILTNDMEKEETVEWFGVKKVIRFQPFWKWLLESG